MTAPIEVSDTMKDFIYAVVVAAQEAFPGNEGFEEFRKGIAHLTQTLDEAASEDAEGTIH